MNKKYILYSLVLSINGFFAFYPTNSQGQYDIWNLINAISAGTWIMTMFYTKIIDDKNNYVENIRNEIVSHREIFNRWYLDRFNNENAVEFQNDTTEQQPDIVELSYVNTDENFNLNRIAQYYREELERINAIESQYESESIYDESGRVLTYENEQEEPTNEEMIEYFDNELKNYKKTRLEQPNNLSKVDSEIII